MNLHQFSKRLTPFSNLVVGIVSSKYFLAVAFIWFLAQTILFAFSVPFGLPPDERTHLGFIELFANSGFSPFITSQEGYYWLGESTRNPFYLYHYLLSFPYALVQGWEHGYVLLRLINVGFGIATLLVLIKIAHQLQLSKLATNLGIAMLSCTLMFTFLFGAISYDNLFVLLSVSSVSLLLAYIKRGDSRVLIALMIILCAGLLVKVNFIPVAGIIGILLVVFLARNIKSAWKKFQVSFRSHLLASLILLVALIPAAGLLIERYGVNLVTYRTYEPSCTQVLTLEQCRESSLFVRNEKIYDTDSRKASKNFFEYTFNWVGLIGERTYGIFAHKQFAPFGILLAGIFVAWGIGAIAVVRQFKKTSRSVNLLFLLSLLYVLVVLIENFSIYLESGRASFAVHGRYLFAALPLLYLALAEYITRFAERVKTVRAMGLVLLIILFFAASLPSYLLLASSEWYV